VNRERFFFHDGYEPNSLNFLFCYVGNPSIGMNVYRFAGWCCEITNDPLVRLIAETAAEQGANDKGREKFHLMPSSYRCAGHGHCHERLVSRSFTGSIARKTAVKDTAKRKEIPNHVCRNNENARFG